MNTLNFSTDIGITFFKTEISAKICNNKAIEIFGNLPPTKSGTHIIPLWF